MTYSTDPTSGAGVIATGTNMWIGDLTPCPGTTSCPAPDVQRITGNILVAFGAGPAGRQHPAKSDAATSYR
jgi:hypothetical protein